MSLRSRYQGIPQPVQDLLSGGEHHHVDYKQIVPNDFAISVAAAANTVALREDYEEFVFLIGVEEVTGAGGVRTGNVTGLVDRRTGQIRDIETEKQRAVQAAGQVVPRPQVDVVDCNAGTASPFFLVRIRPSDPPHRFGDRYPMRLGSHTQALDQASLRRLMGTTIQDWIRTAGSGHDDIPVPLLLDEMLDAQEQIARLRFDLADEIEDRRRSSQYLDNLIRESADHLGTRVDDVEVVVQDLAADHTHGLESLTGQIASTAQSSLESTWTDVRIARTQRWVEFNRRVERGDLPDLAERAGRRLLESFFSAEPRVADYAANQAERSAWMTLAQAGGAMASDSWRSLLDRSCRAALAAAHRGRYEGDWLAMARTDELFDMRDVVVAAEIGFDTLSDLPTGTTETALLLIDADTFSEALEASGVLRFVTPGSLHVARPADCRVEARVGDGGIVALMTIPQPRLAGVPSSTEIFRHLRRRTLHHGLEMLRLYPERDGRLAPLAGQRVSQARIDEQRRQRALPPTRRSPRRT